MGADHQMNEDHIADLLHRANIGSAIETAINDEALEGLPDAISTALGDKP